MCEVWNGVETWRTNSNKLMERFPDQVMFDDCGPLLEQDALDDCKCNLSTILWNVRLSDNTVYCLVEASLPKNGQHQAVLAAILYQDLEEFDRVCHVAW